MFWDPCVCVCVCVHVCSVAQLCPILCDSMDCFPSGSSVHEDFPGKNTGVGCHILLQGIFLTQEWNPCLLHWQADSLPLYHLGRPLLLLLLSRFSCVWFCATPQTAAQQTPPSLGFSRQEYWSGLPFPSPMHENEKWKWSHSVVSNS